MPDLESLTLLELKKLAKENNIRNISKLKKENYPDKIGDYSKEQVTVENVYYIKK